MPEPVSPQGSDDFAGRTALLTGASRGIAAAIAEGLCCAGAHVIIHHSSAADRDSGRPEAAHELEEALRGADGTAHLVDRDLAEAGAGRIVAEEVQSRYGPVEMLVLSAAIQHRKPLVSQSAPEIADQLRINIFANVEILQRLLPDMERRGFGRILSIGSIQETAPSPTMPIYSMTKAALKNLIGTIAIQGATRNVVANTLAPGLIATDRNEHRRADPDAWQRIEAAANPMRRAGQPHELVGLALQLLSPANTFTTGASIPVTGGGHIARPEPGANPLFRVPP